MQSNLKGFAILVLAVGGMVGLGRAFPALGADLFFPLLTAIAFTVVSIAAAAQGIRARLLFLPDWIAGLGAVTWALGALGGVWWILCVVTGLATAISALVVIGLADETRSWREAPARLEEARSAASEQAFWSAASQAFHVPVSYSFPPKISAHDVEVLDLVAARAPADDLPAELAPVREKLEASVRDLEKKSIDRDKVDAFASWLKQRAAKAGSSA